MGMLVEHIFKNTVKPPCERDPVYGLSRCCGQAGCACAELLGELLAIDVQVHADAQDHEVDLCRFGVHLHQDARGLEAVDEDIVRPLDLDPPDVFEAGGDRLGDADRRGEDQGGSFGDRDVGSQDDRRVQVAMGG